MCSAKTQDGGRVKKLKALQGERLQLKAIWVKAAEGGGVWMVGCKSH